MAKIDDVEIPKLIFDEGAAPGTPAAGMVIQYAKADGLLYSKDDAGVETLVSGGVAGLTAPDIQKFFTAGNQTWTKPANAVYVDVWVVGAGSGGGSGRKGAAGSVRMGGSGSGNGGATYKRFLAGDLGATAKLTVGAAGAGGAAQTTNSTNGNAGAAGGASFFGNSADGVSTDAKCSAGAGEAGAAGTATSPVLGGGPGYGNFASKPLGSNAIPADPQPFTAGGASLSTATAIGGAFTYFAGGGGGGGAIHSDNTERAGGAGGRPAENITVVGATGGAVGGANPGATPTPVAQSFAVGGFGGGGGAGSKATVSGGTGGVGTQPGGGGGGGGAALDAATNGGAGGNGADGGVWVITYFA